MVDYSKAKIYKIWNDVDDELYIGATCQRLCQRMAGHRRSVNSPRVKDNDKLYHKMREIGIEHFSIQLIKETPCENAEQLRAIEGEYISKYGTLNRRMAGKDIKEWWDANKEHIAEYQKQYREKNKEHLNKQDKEYYYKTRDERLRKRKEHYYKMKENQVRV